MSGLILLLTGIPALFIFCLGGSIFVVNRPVILPSRWIRILTVLAVLPLLLVRHYGSQHSPLPLVWILIIALSWRAASGYSIYGISSSGLRQALLAVLQKLNLPYTEDMTGITLTSYNAKLGTSMTGLGVCRLRTSNKQVRPILRQVAGELDIYLKNNKVKMSYTFNVLYMLMGLVLIASLLMAYINLNSGPHTRTGYSTHLENRIDFHSGAAG